MIIDIKNNSDIPKIGKTYYYFDDGKIKISRRHDVIITDIIAFDNIDNDILELWKEEVQECYWLYATETDYFIKGELKFSNDEIEHLYFVRTGNNEWFSLGWFGGILDIDGSLDKLIER
jgi:hypothetical protein